MAVSPRDRHRLHTTLAERLGPDEADTIMELLPNQPPDELVTISYFQTEMAAHRAQTHADSTAHKAEMLAEFTDFKTEMRDEFTDFKTEMRDEFTDFKTEVKGDLLRVENQLTLRIAALETAMARTHASMMRWLVALAGINIATAATVIGA